MQHSLAHYRSSLPARSFICAGISGPLPVQVSHNNALQAAPFQLHI